MDSNISLKYRAITVSGKIATGTTTLAKNLSRSLGWKHINIGGIQREFDRVNKINENQQGALSRSDEHERSMEQMTLNMLQKDSNLVYEAWLSGFVAREIPDILRVLLVCGHEDIRIDRVVNRENITIEEAKNWIKQREEENVVKWKQLYGDYDFWDPKYYTVTIDTYGKGPMETLGHVLDKLGYHPKS
ncbi:MAG: cytidylate kinase family protein [bacterium]|nr:cytidylate kinase family protein [bacterium]